MKRINKIELSNKKSIELFQGDLSNIPDEFKTDILIVSAFPNDYIPTDSSLIGSLYKKGLSVEQLSNDKSYDFRKQFHCWLSKPVNILNIRQVLCFEPFDRSNPTKLISGIFQSILSVAFTDITIKTITMPLITTGDQGYDMDYVMGMLLKISEYWLNKDVPFDCIRIVEYDIEKAEKLNQIFSSYEFSQKINIDYNYDFFISYSHQNEEAAENIYNKLKQEYRVYRDKENISIGDFWQNSIYDALEKSRYIISILSPDYLKSQMCIEEFNIGKILSNDRKSKVLLPVYLYSSDLPTYMRLMQYSDAREGNKEKLLKVIDEITTVANKV